MTEEDSNEHDDVDVEYVHNKIKSFKNEFAVPQIGTIKERLDKLEAENEELRQTVKQQGARLEQLDTQLENLIGVDNPDLSTREKRVRDVRAAMIRRAEAKADKDSDAITGKIALNYSEIKDLLADHGHGEIHREQAYRIMDDIENVDGFSKGTKTSSHGNEVKAIRLSLDALPGYARSNNVTTSGVEVNSKYHPNSVAEDNQS